MDGWGVKKGLGGREERKKNCVNLATNLHALLHPMDAVVCSLFPPAQPSSEAPKTPVADLASKLQLRLQEYINRWGQRAGLFVCLFVGLGIGCPPPPRASSLARAWWRCHNLHCTSNMQL